MAQRNVHCYGKIKKATVVIKNNIDPGKYLKVSSKKKIKPAYYNEDKTGYEFTQDVTRSQDTVDGKPEDVFVCFQIKIKTSFYFLVPKNKTKSKEIIKLKLKEAQPSCVYDTESHEIPSNAERYWFLLTTNQSGTAAFLESVLYLGFYLSFEKNEKVLLRKSDKQIPETSNFCLDIINKTANNQDREEKDRDPKVSKTTLKRANEWTENQAGSDHLETDVARSCELTSIPNQTGSNQSFSPNPEKQNDLDDIVGIPGRSQDAPSVKPTCETTVSQNGSGVSEISQENILEHSKKEKNQKDSHIRSVVSESNGTEDITANQTHRKSDMNKERIPTKKQGFLGGLLCACTSAQKYGAT